MGQYSSIGTRTRQLIARGASANASRRMQSRFNERTTITATDISFGSGNTITSAGSGFGAITAGSVVNVSGSPGNSRPFFVDTAAAGSITVLPAILATESAGATIQISEV